MIVSHAHRFVVIEVPRTGTTALSAELVSQYGAVSAGPKHAHRDEALRILGPGVRDYRWIAGVRHPMDDLVSKFQKLMGNHKGRYTDPRRFEENGGPISPGARRRYALLQETNTDFGQYFTRVGRAVHVNGWLQDQRGADLVIRFEDIQAGFTSMLASAGIDQKRPLPRLNPTEGRTADYLSYYGPAVRERAVAVLGPAMLEWGYDWPTDWGIASVPRSSILAYRADRALGRAPSGPVEGLARWTSARLRHHAVPRRFH